MFIDIPSEREAALTDHPLPPWELDGSFLAQSTMEKYRTELTATPRFEEATATLCRALTGEGDGYAVLRPGNLAKALGTGDRFRRLATAFAAEVAVPSSPFPRLPLRKDIEVRVDKVPGSSSSIGQGHPRTPPNPLEAPVMTRLTKTMITPLTATERRVLEQISLGHDPGVGSANLTMARATFNRHSTQIGQKLQVKKPPAKVQMAFVSGQLPLPEALSAPAEFDEQELLLWKAHALHSTAADIAKHANVDQFDLTGETARLMSKAGAANEAHLIRLGHAYGVLARDDVPPPCAA